VIGLSPVASRESCQDISIAGKGEGIHGKRSGLWFEYWRLIRNLRPQFAIMENVGMLIHRGLREVLGSLAEIGYNAEWQDIRAEDMGAPHRRERIWIIAYPAGKSAAGLSSGKKKKYSMPGKSYKYNGENNWATEPAICGVANGIPAELYGYEGRLANKSHRRVDRLKGLGNSIVPQIAELLFNQIKGKI